MEEAEIIRRSYSPRSSLLHIVSKQSSGWRLCGDHRRLDEASTYDRYPLPHIQDFNSHLARARIFSEIDLVRAYHPIPMASVLIPKTAIATSFDLWEFIAHAFWTKKCCSKFPTTNRLLFSRCFRPCFCALGRHFSGQRFRIPASGTFAMRFQFVYFEWLSYQ